MSQSCCFWEVHKEICVPLLNAPLGIDSEFRTIDIDTAAQVNQIGGRFTEALSSSLSVHGAHEEALRRIEHYSMTSMHSSAHSIRSMDSIRTEFRTELSRLETMITSNSSTHPSGPSGVVSEEFQGHPDSSPTVSPLPGRGQESPTTKGSDNEHASQRVSTLESRSGRVSRAQSQGTRRIAAGNRIETDVHKPSKDDRTSTAVTHDESPTGEVNKASDLYAEFSKKLEPHRNESSAITIDSAAVHHVLRQSLATIYPPEVVKYISLRQVTTLCEDHIDFLDRRPSVLLSAVGIMKERADIDSNTRAAARSSMVELRDRLIELRKAIKVSREQCIQAGYTLSELDKLLSPPGTGSYSPAGRPPRKPEMDSGDDSSSIHSEDFHSPAE